MTRLALGAIAAFMLAALFAGSGGEARAQGYSQRYYEAAPRERVYRERRVYDEDDDAYFERRQRYYSRDAVARRNAQRRMREVEVERPRSLNFFQRLFGGGSADTDQRSDQGAVEVRPAKRPPRRRPAVAARPPAPIPADPGAAAAAAASADQARPVEPERGLRPTTTSTVVALPRRDPPARIDPDREIAPPPPAAQIGVAAGKKNYIKISAMLAIALPTALATIYYGLIAAPQYVAEARFAVRGPDAAPSATDALSMLTGLGSTGDAGTISDSYIVSQFIESTQLVGNLQRSLDLRAVYTNDKADFIAKYRPYDFEDTIEHLTNYWNSSTWVYFEPVSSTITLTVRAFTPEEALKIARETVRESEKLVNKLSERSREDAISLAKQELSRAELRLKFARKAVQDYRDRMGQTDPTTAATARSTLIAGLEQQLATQEADIAGRTAFLNKDAPSVRVLRQSADALRSQIEQEKAKIGSQLDDLKKKGVMSASLAEFEALQTEQTFATNAYTASATAVESARMRAEQQTRYLATYVEPHLPEDSLYPARLQMVLLVLLCSALAWAIGVLIFYGIRDHTA